MLSASGRPSKRREKGQKLKFHLGENADSEKLASREILVIISFWYAKINSSVSTQKRVC